MKVYEDRLPEGTAYVRFVNTTSEKLDLSPTGIADPLSLGRDGADRVSAYHVVEKVTGRKFTVQLPGDKRVDLELRPNRFQTILIEADGSGWALKPVIDQIELSQTKARIAFYNAAPTCASASLLLEPKRQVVFADLPPRAVKNRLVNPAENPRMAATCGTAAVPPADIGGLDAGGQYSVWLMAIAGSPGLFSSKNAIAAYQR